MKDALFYTLRRGPHGSRRTIMAVTTEKGKGNYRHLFYGRDQHDMPTNAASRDCTGRFATKELAEAAKVVVDAAYAEHEPAIKEANEACARAYSAQVKAVEMAVKEACGS